MTLGFDCDVLVIGAGPAGTSSAILLARAGRRVIIVEQNEYPRRKVCGECIAAGNLPLLDGLGIGAAWRRAAGPDLRRVGWMDRDTTVVADMPPCTQGPYPFGRVLGRDRLDHMLLERARSLGVTVLQPARARMLRGQPGSFECVIEAVDHRPGAATPSRSTAVYRAPIVIDAHGSWERSPSCAGSEVSDTPSVEPVRAPRLDADLFAFKANFRHSALQPGFLPVLALPGGYGGMVVGDDGRMTLACCLRRDVLAACRVAAPHAPAGSAVEAFLQRNCAGVRAALEGAQREGPWLSVGPLRPGMRLGDVHGPFRVGNAAGESHPLIGEGISMALQSSVLLARTLTGWPRTTFDARSGVELHRAYAAAWHRAFAPRLRLAALYAHLAMRPALAAPIRGLLRRWPTLLQGGARLAGKAAAAPAIPSSTITEAA